MHRSVRTPYLHTRYVRPPRWISPRMRLFSASTGNTTSNEMALGALATVAMVLLAHLLPFSHRFAQTYSSCVEQPIQRLFFALAAELNYKVYGGDATDAFAHSPPPERPTFLAWVSWFMREVFVVAKLLFCKIK